MKGGFGFIVSMSSGVGFVSSIILQDAFRFRDRADDRAINDVFELAFLLYRSIFQTDSSTIVLVERDI